MAGIRYTGEDWGGGGGGGGVMGRSGMTPALHTVLDISTDSSSPHHPPIPPPIRSLTPSRTNRSSSLISIESFHGYIVFYSDIFTLLIRRHTIGSGTFLVQYAPSFVNYIIYTKIEEAQAYIVYSNI